MRLTVDHGIDALPEVKRIEQAGGFVFRGRVCGLLAITRSLGDQILKQFITAQPAVREISVPADTKDQYFLIVACDGLWDVMTDLEAVNLVVAYCNDDPSYDGQKKSQAADCLVKESLRRGTSDNVTAVVVWLL
jgi:serine/threonine protein phosphatase PrpC